MDSYEETFNTWNKIAELYQEKFMELNIYDHAYDFLLKNLISSHSKVLELGCGPGNISKYLLSKKPSLSITGLDISPRMVELAALNNPNAIFYEKDIRQLDEIEGEFHAIVGGFCLPYLSTSDAIKLLKDCKNLLKSEGLLFLSFVAGESKDSGFIAGSTGERTYFYFHDTDYLIDQANQYSFELIYKDTVKYPKENSQTENHISLLFRSK